MVTFDAIREARERIAPHVHRTPVLTCATFDRELGMRLFFKCENLQKVGAFKFRGATNAIAQLDDATAARGVVTHSSGNHAQAVARAARERGIAATIVMPTRRAKLIMSPLSPSIICAKRGAVEDESASGMKASRTIIACNSTK